MIKHDVIQYSDLWWELRMGVPTASCFDKILTPGGKLSAQAEKYIDQLIAERICPQPNFFTEREGHTAAMRNGIATEPQARRYFELETNQTVQQSKTHDGPWRGFITTDDGRFGCSPDFLTNTDEPGELKCPDLDTHIGYLRKGTLPKDYLPQCHGHMAVTGKPRCWFMSYNVASPDQLLIQVTEDEFTQKLRIQMELFWDKFSEAFERFKVKE